MNTEGKRYFEGKAAEEFDAIYDDRGSTYARLINRVFRKGIRERVALTLKECEGRTGTVLDIGCGSGRVSLLMARKGLKVVGVDYSASMIQLAERYLQEERRRNPGELEVEFVEADFMAGFDADRAFDITVALGVFDYIDQPKPFLHKMRRLSKEMMIAAFPDRYAFQMPIRKLWLYTRGCPVYFYSARDIRRLYGSEGIENYEITKVAAGFFVKATFAPAS